MKEYICPDCLNVGQPKKMKRGSKGVEIFLWMMFPLGVPYSIWRYFARYDACKQCSRAGLVDVNTNFGKVLMMRYEREVLGIDPKDNPNLEKYLNKVTHKDADEKLATAEDFVKKAPEVRIETKLPEHLEEKIFEEASHAETEDSSKHKWEAREKKAAPVDVKQDDW